MKLFCTLAADDLLSVTESKFDLSGVRLSHNVNIEGSTVITGSRLNRTTISNNAISATVTRENWKELFMLIGKYGKDDDMDRMLELQSLLEDKKRAEAKPVWQKLRIFLSGLLQHSANLAQIIGTIDTITRS